MKNESRTKKYYPRPNGRYKNIYKNGKKIREHRYIWEQVHGPIPNGYEIHHINFQPKDNRLENLEILTPTEHRRKHLGFIKRPDGTWLKPCRKCKVLKDLETQYRMHKGVRYYICKPCDYEDKKIWAKQKKAQSPVTA